MLGTGASLLLFCMMVLTFADVVARYLFNHPIRGAFEITELLLLVLIFAGLPLVSRADEHVTMDFIDHILPERALEVLARAIHALAAACFFLLAWRVWIKAGSVSRYGDTTDVLHIAVGYFVYFMAVMILLTGLVHLFKLFLPGARRAGQTTL